MSGVIDKFFIQFELGWKVLKELLMYEGVAAAATGSPRLVIKEAYRYYPCMEEEIWLAMLSQRNNMTHLYDGQAAKNLADTIIREYIPAFRKLEESIRNRYEAMLQSV